MLRKHETFQVFSATWLMFKPITVYYKMIEFERPMVEAVNPFIKSLFAARGIRVENLLGHLRPQVTKLPSTSTVATPARKRSAEKTQHHSETDTSAAVSHERSKLAWPVVK